MSSLFLLGLGFIGFAVGMACLIALIAALSRWRFSVHVVDEEELRKASL
jgi:hypothetical protein